MIPIAEQTKLNDSVPLVVCKEIKGEQDCPYCQHKVELIWVHGHYQCPNCKHVVVSCCGDS